MIFCCEVTCILEKEQYALGRVSYSGSSFRTRSRVMHCRNSPGLAEKLEALGSTDPWLVAKSWTIILDLGDPCKFPVVGREEIYPVDILSGLAPSSSSA
jgi:hypothetical protein